MQEFIRLFKVTWDIDRRACLCPVAANKECGTISQAFVRLMRLVNALFEGNRTRRKFEDALLTVLHSETESGLKCLTFK